MDQLKVILNALNNNIFSKPEFVMAIVVFIGALLMKKKWYEAITGSIKTIVGFYILTAGSDGITATFKPIMTALSAKFGVNAVMLDTYFTGANLMNKVNGVGTMGNAVTWGLLVWAVCVATNILLVMFQKVTKCRTFFVRNNYNPMLLDMWVLFGVLPEAARTLPVAILCGIARGIHTTVFSNLTVEASDKLTGGAGLAVGHNQMLGVYLADKFGELIGKKEKVKEEAKGATKKELPGWLSMFNDTTVSTAIIMTIFFGTIMLVLGQETMMEYDSSCTTKIWYGVYVFTKCLNFAVYLNILLLGVRMFTAEIQKGMKGLTDKFMKGSILAVDCAVMYGFADAQAIMLGFIAGFCGQMLAILAIIFLKAPIIVATGFIPMFFDNATIGVFAYRAGGKKAAIIAGFVGGLVQVVGGYIAVSACYSFGFQVPAYVGTFDAGSVTMVRLLATRYFGVIGLIVYCVAMLAIPQIQYIKNKEGYWDKVGE